MNHAINYNLVPGSGADMSSPFGIKAVQLITSLTGVTVLQTAGYFLLIIFSYAKQKKSDREPQTGS